MESNEQENPDLSFTFDGQQEGERVLYVIRLHGIKKIINIAQGLFLAVVFYALLSFVPEFVDVNPQYFRVLIAIITALIFILRVWWGELYFEHSKTVLTDRRIIRFELTLPFFKSRRALFWKEVAKVKTTAHNPIFALCKIGTLTVQPVMIPGEEISIPYVYYFGDLASYIDKIIYLEKAKPEEIAFLRPFVPKPRGERY